MIWTVTIIFAAGIILGIAAGYRVGWNAHVDYRLRKDIEKIQRVAEEDRL